MDWQEYINTDSEILAGKTAVIGTRLSAEFVMCLFAAGWSETQVLDNYPQLSREAIRAVFAYAVECLRSY
jgi:uncharacterized protein (DUF433 family)